MALADCPTEIALKQGRVVRGPTRRSSSGKTARASPSFLIPPPCVMSTGAIVGVVNMTVDITERKIAEHAPRRARDAVVPRRQGRPLSAVSRTISTLRKSRFQRAIRPFTVCPMERPTLRAACGKWACIQMISSVWRNSETACSVTGDANMAPSIALSVPGPRCDGSRRVVSSRTALTSRPQRVVGVNIDITGRKRADEHQRVLVAELDHRVKNVLATVSAVAAHTLDTSSSMDDFVAALDGRIRSMATMQ